MSIVSVSPETGGLSDAAYVMASVQMTYWGDVIQMGDSPKENAMFLKSRLVKVSVMLVALLCMRAPSQLFAGGTAVSTVSITATVDSFTEWANATPAILAADWTGGVLGHIAHANTTLTVSKTLTLFTNQSVTVTPTSGGTGILTNGTQVLTTSYTLTGPGALASQDGAPVAAATFITQSYALTHASGTGQYDLVLGVTAVGPNAPDAGDYTADVIMTASW